MLDVCAARRGAPLARRLSDVGSLNACQTGTRTTCPRDRRNRAGKDGRLGMDDDGGARRVTPSAMGLQIGLQ